jgi:hypothetical protein
MRQVPACAGKCAQSVEQQRNRGAELLATAATVDQDPMWPIGKP